MKKKEVKEGTIFGCVYFHDLKEKKKIVSQLRSEFRPNLRLWVDNNLITYESSVSCD